MQIQDHDGRATGGSLSSSLETRTPHETLEITVPTNNPKGSDDPPPRDPSEGEKERTKKPPSPSGDGKDRLIPMAALLANLVLKAGMRAEVHTVFFGVRDGALMRGGVGGWKADVDHSSGDLRHKRSFKGPTRQNILRYLEPNRKMLEALEHGKIEMDYLGGCVKAFRIETEVRPTVHPEDDLKDAGD